jgi:hypothetical protein
VLCFFPSHLVFHLSYACVSFDLVLQFGWFGVCGFRMLSIGECCLDRDVVHVSSPYRTLNLCWSLGCVINGIDILFGSVCICSIALE